MKLSDIPDWDRPRERLLMQGISCLSSVELIALLLGSCGAKKDVLEVSASILREFRDLSGLSRATLSELCSLTGIGRAKAGILLAALELGKRAVGDSPSRVKNGDWKQSLQLWAIELSLQEREYIISIYVDDRNRVIEDDKVSYGGIDGAFLDTGYLLRRAIRLGAKGLVLLHNHPDGSEVPSNDDILLTEYISRQLSVLGLEMIGHYLCAAGNITEIAITR